jgi:hypothetical protein
MKNDDEFDSYSDILFLTSLKNYFIRNFFQIPGLYDIVLGTYREE